MDRIEKTKEYLKQQRATFQNFESLRNSKNEFFDRIKQFKEVTIDNLTKFKTIPKKDLDEFGEILRQFEAQRSKGLGTAVYWPGTGPLFDKALSKLDELILNVDQTRLDFKIRAWDYVKGILVDPMVYGTIFAAIIIIIMNKMFSDPIAVRITIGGFFILLILSLLYRIVKLGKH